MTGQRLFACAILAAALVLFAAMPHWRAGAGDRTSYALTPEEFEGVLALQLSRHGTGGERDGVAVVKPPPGDVYLQARRWRFEPALELEAGRSYRLHATSADILHGLHVGGQDALLAPGRVAVVEVTPLQPGRLIIQCSEFCGSEHNRMKLEVGVAETGLTER